LQIGEAHAGIGNREIGDALEAVAVLVPVIGEFLEHDAVLDHALDEFIGPGADRLGAELVAQLLRRLRCDDDTGAVGELRQQRRERPQ